MSLHPNKHISFFLKVGYVICAAAALYLFFKYAFAWTVPLIVAILMSSLIEKPVKSLERLKVPRKIAAIVCTFLYLTLFGLLIYVLVTVSYTQIKNLISEMPSLVASLSVKFSDVSQGFEQWFSKLPFDEFFNFETLSGFLSNIKLPSFNPSTIVNPLFRAATSVPTMLITTVFTFVATFFLTSRRKEIFGFVKNQMSPRAQEIFFELQKYLSSSVFGWIKAQAILVCVTFCELFVGFLIMGLEYAFILALVIAFIDALPVLGVGGILIPWAIVNLFTGDIVGALSLCIIYAVALVVRNSIEPKILGVQIGLHPFLTLLCIYFGYRLAGFGGMFALPVTVICLTKLHDMGVIKLYKEGPSEE